MTEKNKNYCIIMAGGIGSRFWPMSTPDHPKQFLDVLGTGRSLIRMTYERLLHIAPSEQVYILTNERYKDLVLEQLPELDPSQVLTEPKRKNTAPCIAYAAAKIRALDPNATMIITPADHLITKEIRFTEIIHTAIRQANSGERLVTLGIQPTRPDTGYGYIEFADDVAITAGDVTPVRQFREKPDLHTAERFVAQGNFYWNSGIFVWRADAVLNALAKYASELHSIFTENTSAYNTRDEQAYVNQCFERCEDISIDYAIMEHASNVDVVLADFDWSDLGTWGSLGAHLSKDFNGNSVIGKHAHLFHSKDCIVNVSDDKLVLLDGLENYIVVESENMFMVLRGENEQELKNFLKKVEKDSPGFFSE
ncbi:MAG: mannose-1-phosphate guanylyltransferase [Bacteroidota bacterium]|jgi:mannose-1-phosphate guanylyltransferase